jgi:hypothetical protein
MMFARRLREGVREGRITYSLPIWTRPHVRVAGVYPMEGGHSFSSRSARLLGMDALPLFERVSVDFPNRRVRLLAPGTAERTGTVLVRAGSTGRRGQAMESADREVSVRESSAPGPWPDSRSSPPPWRFQLW